MTPRTFTGVRRVLIVAAAGCALAACSSPPTRSAGQATAAPAGASPAATGTATASSLPPPPPPPPLSAPSPTFAEDTTAACAGHPSADQVTAQVRTGGAVAAGAKLTARLGPLCAGGWQYTVFTVAGREPLQVVTMIGPAGLTLVTAGTDVCSAVVLTSAPVGIVNVAHCGLGAPPGTAVG
jgi:hypothetical protein